MYILILVGLLSFCDKKPIQEIGFHLSDKFDTLNLKMQGIDTIIYEGIFCVDSTFMYENELKKCKVYINYGKFPFYLFSICGLASTSSQLSDTSFCQLDTNYLKANFNNPKFYIQNSIEYCFSYYSYSIYKESPFYDTIYSLNARYSNRISPTFYEVNMTGLKKYSNGMDLILLRNLHSIKFLNH